MKVLLATLLCAFASDLFTADAGDRRHVIDGGQAPPDLIGIGQDLSLRTEELGMGEYQFTGRRVQFSATLFSSAGACLNLGPGEQPPKPPTNPERALLLRCTVPSARASLEAVNAWNETDYPMHVSTAIYDRDGTATLHAVMHLEHSVTPATLQDFVQRFCQEIEAFKRHLKGWHP